MIEIKNIMMGGDPEIFLEQDGKIIGSEKVVPSEGICYTERAKVVRDGVQAEIHFPPQTCRGTMGNLMRNVLTHFISKLPKGTTISDKAVVNVTMKELKSLSPESRVLGCAPSLNVYDASLQTIERDETFRTRSAGGHVHLDLRDWRIAPERIPDLVKVLDIVVGNTCVLIDRGRDQAIRRQTYGRAGEYRLPSHGLEYRTLSNFWLRAFPLMSFVFGLTRMAFSVVYARKEKDLMGLVDLNLVIRAINENDPKLARINFDQISKFLSVNFKPITSERYAFKQLQPFYLLDYNKPIGHAPMEHVGPQLTEEFIKDFNYFVSKPLSKWFPLSTHEYWAKMFGKTHPIKEMWEFNSQKMIPHPSGGDLGHYSGWESFLLGTVRPKRVAYQIWLDSRKKSRLKSRKSPLVILPETITRNEAILG